MQIVKEQTGVVIEKDGLYWGVEYNGEGHGEGQVMGWVALPKANVYDPEFLINPTDATYFESTYYDDLATAVIKTVTIHQVTEYTVGP